MDLILAGALPAALVGGGEAALLVWRLCPDPELDLGTLAFAVCSYAAAGALLSLLLYLPARLLSRRSGWELFPWRGGAAGAGGLAGAWALAQLLLWLALSAGTFNATRLNLPLGSRPGLLGVVGSLLLAYGLGWLLVPRLAARRGRAPRALLAAGLLAVLAAGWLLPRALATFVYRVDEIPAATARRHNPEPADGPPALAQVEAPGPPSATLPDVILITLDTTRADHLSAYGYTRDTTPRLEEFARDAVRFDSAWSASSWTVPAHATLFTGLFPHTHGARYMTRAELERERDYTPAAPAKIRPLDPAHRTLAEILRARGYRTGACVGGPYLYAEYGMAQGFEWYDDRFTVSAAPKLALYRWLDRGPLRLQPDWFRFDSGYRWGDRINAAVFDWLADLGEQRFFLFVNYFDAHEPYTPLARYRTRYSGAQRRASEAEQRQVFQAVMSGVREISDQEKEWLASQYDAELRFQDEQMGLLFDRLKAAGRYEQALIIVTADHGESLGEQNQLSHGFNLYAPVTHIPLLVKFPAADGVVVGTRSYPVHQADVLPTILRRLAVDAGAVEGVPLQGRELFDTSQPHVILSELERDNWKVQRFGERWSRRIHTWTEGVRRLHQVQPVDAAGEPLGAALLELYDVAQDPLELQPLAPAGAASLRALLSRWLEGAKSYQPSPWMQHLQAGGGAAALAEMGYADGVHAGEDLDQVAEEPRRKP